MHTEKVREKGYHLAKPATSGGGKLELSRFFDTKTEYMQHGPPRVLRGLGKELAESPFIRPQGPRECLSKAVDIYRGTIQEEQFVNSQEKREQVKFGLLIAYPREKDKSDKGKKIADSAETGMAEENA